MDVNKADAVISAGRGSPKKDQNHGAVKEKQEDKNLAGGEFPWEGAEAFAVDGVLADDLGFELQKTIEGLAAQIEPLRAEVERLKADRNRAGKAIEWDAKQMLATNVPEANAFLDEEYREGWSL